MTDLSADELALYDRQLRVWGTEGQHRIKSASILLITLNGVGNEIVKNLVLAGVGSLEIWDPSAVLESDLSTQFFLAETDLHKRKLVAVEPRIRDMNPRVNLTINTLPLNFSNYAEYFSRFSVVITNQLDSQLMVQLNTITRELNIALYATTVHGLYAWYFSDLILNISTFTKKKMPLARKPGKISLNREIISVKALLDKESNQVMETFTVKSSYKPWNQIPKTTNLAHLRKRAKKNVSPYLSIFIALVELQFSNIEITHDALISQTAEVVSNLSLNEFDSAPFVSNILRQLNSEISPIAAILGGTLAQDVINYLSGKELPINNMLILDGDTCSMPIYEL